MLHEPTTLTNVINIESLMTFYYFEMSKDFYYRGESHDFWEIVYVDQGSTYIRFSQGDQLVNQGTLVLHKPDEFHAIKGTEKNEAHVMIISFNSKSFCLEKLADRHIWLNHEEKQILHKFYKVAKESFADCCSNGKAIQLVMKENPLWGGKQLLKGYMEELFILLMQRHYQGQIEKQKRSKVLGEKDYVEEMKSYIEQHLQRRITSEELSYRYGMSKSKLYQLFKENEQCSVKEYIIRAKIKKAKVLLREKKYTITEISSLLGYYSIHHFSMQFKDRTGVIPSQYADSIKYQRDVTIDT